MKSRCAVVFMIAAAVALAQKPKDTANARELYYFAVAKKDALPPLQAVAAPGRASAGMKRAAPGRETKAVPAQPASPAPAGAVHLGFRYNVTMVNPNSGQATLVGSDRMFRTGECFGIEIEANRSGYLYVLAKQSSGNWIPLLPSDQMANESNVIDPGQKVRIPKDYCFEVHEPAGTETLFVVLSRNPADIYDLHMGIKGKVESAPPAPRPGYQTEPVQLADARMVNSQVASLTRQFATRDIVIRRVEQPQSKQEPPHAVYVVDASDKPSSTVMAQIEIRHQ